MILKLYVGNLSYATTEAELHTLFSNSGTVTSISLIKDRETGRSKGFAFIEMSSQAEVEEAIKQYNGSSLNNREMKVNIARPPEKRAFSGNKNQTGRGNSRNRSRRGGGRDDRRRY